MLTFLLTSPLDSCMLIVMETTRGRQRKGAPSAGAARATQRTTHNGDTHNMARKSAKTTAEKYQTVSADGLMTTFVKPQVLIGEQKVDVSFRAPIRAAVTFAKGLDAPDEWYGLLVDAAFRRAYSALRATQGDVYVQWKGKRTNLLDIPRPFLAGALNNVMLRLAGAKAGARVKGAEKLQRIADAAVSRGILTVSELEGVKMYTPAPQK